MSTKDNYNYYKSRGICVRCKKEKALKGLVHCLMCNMDTRENSKISYLQLDDATRRRRREHSKRRTDLLKAFGVCVHCGKNDAEEGRIRCRKCLDYVNAQVKKKRKKETKVKREDRVYLGLCYICGKPKLENYNVCEEHLKVILSNQSKRHTKNNNEAHIWKQCVL